jgi:nicotinate phosphoribosyltransferase
VNNTPFYISQGLPLPLFTDFYELTMAYAHWKSGTMNLPAVFTLTFRSNPFKGGYTVAAGLRSVADFILNYKIQEAEASFIAELKGVDDKPLFEAAFIDRLKNTRLACDVWAVPEGTVVFPNEPVLRVQGPIWQCQMLEAALLNIINFQSLIATKATRMVYAARGGKIIEFGMRRAQGFDGAISASRAAYIGGVHATSNVLAAKLFGIPLAGTHAHSWVMAFEDELTAFRKYARALPDQCVLLVDTYDTARGVNHAIKVGVELAKNGKRLAAIRLDSGDFAFLSEQARKNLDAAGLHQTEIIASNELDEYLIQSLHLQGAKIDHWGVGTKLVTAQDQPALNGVYKLSALYEGGVWKNKMKVSNQTSKTSNPGRQRLRRFYNASGQIEADLIYEESECPETIKHICDPSQLNRTKKIQPEWSSRDLLEQVISDGKITKLLPSIFETREHTQRELNLLHAGHRRFENPHEYRVGLSPELLKIKQALMAQLGGE